jgi:hypothetical protein
MPEGGTKPSDPRLNSASDYYANIADCIAFTDGSGNTATALAGGNLSIGGTETTDFDWETVAGWGGYVTRSTTSGTILFPGFTGSGAEGTVVLVVRKTATAGGTFYHFGREVADFIGDTSGYIYSNNTHVGFRHKESGAITTTQSTNLFAVDEWTPVVFTWRAGDSMTLGYITSADGVTTISRSPAPSSGFSYSFLFPVRVAGGFPGAGSVQDDTANFDVAYVLRLNTLIPSDDITTYLTLPFLNLREVDSSGPSLEITEPEDESSVVGPSVHCLGTALETGAPISLVEAKVNDGDWVEAAGTEEWDIWVNVPIGENTIQIRATNEDGSATTSSRTVTRTVDTFTGNNGVFWKGRSGTPERHWTGVDW